MNLFYRITSLLLVVVLLLQASAIDIGNSWYYTLILGAIMSVALFLTNNGHPRLDYSIIFLLLIAACSIFVNGAIGIFRPWERFIGFIILLISFSGLFPQLYKQREFMFKSFKWFLSVFVIASFIIGILGIQLNVDRHDFCGVANHSMMLAPLASISAILFFDDIYHRHGNKLVVWALFFISVVTAFLAASRISLGSLALSLLSYLFANRKINSLWKYLISFTIVITLLLVINPYGVADNFVNKMADRDIHDLDSMTSDRWTMIQDRIVEFKESPIFGVGFAQMKHIKLSKIDMSSGVIETGSSWVYLLSSMGLMGAISFFIILAKGLKSGYQNNSFVYLAITVFFIIHMSAEGYLFAFGSPLCALFWFFLGLSSAPKPNEQTGDIL